MNDFFTCQAGIPESQPALLLAPMEGITNHLFRERILETEGPDIVATEFIRITSENQRVSPFHRHGKPLQIQIMGCSAEIIRGNLLFLKEKGVIHESDWIDLNVGCPSKRVTAHGSGAALLKQPETLVRIIDSLRSVHAGPLSIKTRIGFETTADFPAVLHALAECALDFISIHARTKQAGYTPGIHLEQLRLAVDALPYPVIGNGDIWDITAARTMLEETGVRGLMIGRGAVRNPFIFKQIRTFFTSGQETPSSHADCISFAMDLLSDYKRIEDATNKPHSYVGTYKEFFAWLSKNPLLGSKYFDLIKRHNSLEAIQARLSTGLPSDSQDLW